MPRDFARPCVSLSVCLSVPRAPPRSLRAMPEPPQTREETLDGAHPAPPLPVRPAPTHPASRVAVLFDISRLLQTGLDRETLSTLVGLTENGVNPEALATVVKELRRESAQLQAAESAAGRNAAAEPPSRT